MERQAYIRPSAAGTWSRCAGYAALNAALDTDYVEETDNEVREDGTACHWLADQVWNGSRPSVGSLSPNGREITEEMYVAVAEYHALLRTWATDTIEIESKVPVSLHFPGVADGTPDAWGYHVASATLDVGDLKYGFRVVDEWRNAQLIIYAWTLVCELSAGGDAPQRILLHIVQPRAPHRRGTTRTWELSVSELAEHAAALAAAAQACYAPEPPCVPGPWCRNCPAAHGCMTLAAAAASSVEVSYDATPFVLTEQQLGYELTRLTQAKDHIEHRINGLSMQAESLIRKGKRVPGFGLTRRVTRWRWRDGSEPILRRLGELFGVDVMQEPKLRTVAQLRDSFPMDVQAMYAEKPDGELKLKLTDPNEAIRGFTQR